MALSIGRSLARGTRHSLSRSGAVVFLLTVLSQVIVMAALNTILRSALPEELHGASVGLVLPVGDRVAAILAFGGVFLGVVATVVAVRALTRDQAELDRLPSSLATRRLGWAAISLLGSGIVVWLAVILGSILVVPGLFFAVCFLFVPFFICIEDDRALTALRRSWGLTSGNRWRLLGILLVAVVGTGVVNAVAGAISLVNLTAAQVANIVVTSMFSIVLIGAIGDAFRQLRREDHL